MDAGLKKILKSVTLELRHLLEGRYDSAGAWQSGDLELRLAAIGVRRDRTSLPVDELPHLAEEDRHARKVVDAYLKLREDAGVDRQVAVADFVREAAYTWANRLLVLRCMEARDLIDSVILQQEAYGGRSLEHHRLAQRHPELCAGEDDGLFAVLNQVFQQQAKHLPMLFDPQAPGIVLRPSPAAIKDCFGLLSLQPEKLKKYRIRLKDDADGDTGRDAPNPFVAPDALGWAYQYWNTEEKERVFERVRTVKGAKIAGSDIVPATQLYTEDYMVKFLVQNSLGANWMGMHPASRLCGGWEYYVRDPNRAPVQTKPVEEITFLDPACGSGHFLLEAFDLFYAMYEEEGRLTDPEQICAAILTRNLFGIDIDARSVQIAEAALWMKAAEKAFEFQGEATNLVAATASHLKGESWEEFLDSFQREPSVARVLRKFAQSMEHIDEIGSLARPAEELREIIREEHSTWERQVREQRETNYLFPEMNRAALQGHLPFHEISEDEFGERLFYRAKAGIDTFTQRARESGVFEDQMLGDETRAGFRLVDLLSRRYDVVAANPPYMGSPNMGDRLRALLRNTYALGANDLFAAFILRCGTLTQPMGATAMVTQQSWLFLRDYARLRTGEGQGLFDRYSLELVAPLGPNAFEEIKGEVVSAALFVLRSVKPTPQYTIKGIRINQRAESPQKDDALRRAAREGLCMYSVTAEDLASIPESPAVFWLGGQLFDLLKSTTRVSAYFTVRQGLATTDDPRFVRWWWETPSSDASRWHRFVKGGGYRKWWGFNASKLDWQHDGARLKLYVVEIKGNTHWSRRLASSEFYFKEGLTYSDVASGCLGARVMPSGSLFAASSPGIFRCGDGAPSWAVALGFLNSRLATFLARTTSPNPMHFSVGYVANLPFLSGSDIQLEQLAESATALKREIDSIPIISDEHIPTELSLNLEAIDSRIRDRIERKVVLLLLEAMSDSRVSELLQLTEDTKDTLSLTLGTLAGSQPCTIGAADHLQRDRFLPADVHTAVQRHLERLSQLGPTSLGLNSNRISSEDMRESDGNEEHPTEIVDLLNECHSFPNEFELESVCNERKLNPADLLNNVIKTGANDNRIWNQFRQAEVGDRVSTAVLLLLGHNWPCRGANDPFLPDFDGILPLLPVSQSTLDSDSTLLGRLKRSWRKLADNGVSSDDQVFESAFQISLESWLATEFFKHHTQQFKKRPIAWQLQSGMFTTRKAPAFACLLYYHKLDSDSLPKLRSQYVGPLRQRLETEQRGIQTIAAEARSDRQVTRLTELENAIAELQKFEATLDAVSKAGFGPRSVQGDLRQYGFDDAFLAHKARWLRRLSELVSRLPLPNWLEEAGRTGLHPDLSTWVADSIAHLDHFCAKVGPKAPEQAKLVDDPTPMELANLISAQAMSMVKESLGLACDRWWEIFDEAVLLPDREQVKALKEEQKDCEANLAADPTLSSAEARRMRLRVKDIKGEIKTLNAAIKERSARASKLRSRIEGWESQEPNTWGEWLASQPLFDRISSLDGRRTIPSTIADFIAQESLFAPDINDGVRVNIAPLQKAGVLAADVLAAKDVDKAITDRAQWRADERRWVREGKLPQPGWWSETEAQS